MNALPRWVEAQRNLNKANFVQLNDHAEAHWQAFLKQGWPKSKTASWQHADLSFLNQDFIAPHGAINEKMTQLIQDKHAWLAEAFLLVFVDGFFVKTHTHLPDHRSLMIDSLTSVLKHDDQLLRPYLLNAQQMMNQSFAHLAASIFSDGIVILIPDEVVLEKPIHLLFLYTNKDQPSVLANQHMLVLGKNSRLTLIEEHVSGAEDTHFVNTLHTWHMGAAANLDYYKMQMETGKINHITTTFLQQEKDSQARLSYFSHQHGLLRDELHVNLAGAGANCQTIGLYQLNRSQQSCHHHVYIQHQAPHTESNMLYKGIIAQGSSAEFQGKITVAQAAQHVKAYQGNHHLLCSQDAKAYSQPELEIYADDVQCKHGATTAQLREEVLFYLQSRGISAETARDMLLQGFADEVVQTIVAPPVKKRLQQQVFGDDNNT